MSPGPNALLAEALDLVHSDLTRYVSFPSPEAADALTLWIAATHCQDQWEHASRFVLKSPIKRCGKTRAAEVTRELVGKPFVAGSVSPAAVVRMIDAAAPPTLILDEADAVFGKNSNGETAEALRQILNLGHSRGWPYVRWDVKRREPELCPTFAMALIAGIGDLPDTIEDRAVVVSMQRRAPGETVAQFRQRDAADLHRTRTILEKALDLTLGRYDGYEPPAMPVEDRAADVWEPLVVVADTAGRDWPGRARAACKALTGEGEEEASLGQKLLADLKRIWQGEEKLATATILERLQGLEESPWADYYGRPINPRELARLLRPYQVKSSTVRISDTKTLKGYARADLHPVWVRYTHDSGEGSQTSQVSQGDDNGTATGNLTRGVTDVPDVTDFRAQADDVPSPDPIEEAMNNLADVGFTFTEECSYCGYIDHTTDCPYGKEPARA